MDQARWDQCPHGVKHEAQIQEIVRRMSVVEEAIVEIRDRLLGRPSWIVVSALTTLFALSSSLVVYITTH